jgi:hypothetical protein
MLPVCLVLATLAPADNLREAGPASPTLRELCIDAPVVVLARPVDPVVPVRFTVLSVLRGKEVRVGQVLAPRGLVEKEVRFFDESDPQTRKPRPCRIDQALLFLRPGKSGLEVMPTGFRLCSEDGRVLVPVAALGEKSEAKPLRVAGGVTWVALTERVRADLASVDQLHVLRNLGRGGRRTRRLLDWVQKRRTEFGSPATLSPGDLAPVGWGKLGYQVFDWIFERESRADCWEAVKVYADLNRGEAPKLSSPVFSSPAGRQFLLAIAGDRKQLAGDRRRALEVLAQPITLWPPRDSSAWLSAAEQEEFLEQFRLLLTDRDHDLKRAVVAAMLQVSRPGKGQAPRPAEVLVNTLAEMYRPTPPGAYRDELARTLCQVAPEKYRKLSGNPVGVCACLEGFQLGNGELRFLVDLRLVKHTVFEQPALVLEKLDANNRVVETKRAPLPVLNLPAAWPRGVSGDQVLAVQVELARVIPVPQINQGRSPRDGVPAPTTWQVRVEGSVGQGTAKQPWKSEARRIIVRPVRPGMPGGLYLDHLKG